MLCRKKLCGSEDNGSAPVRLNVYDITPLNGYAYWLGLGVYHSGVEVHGVEYAFGAHDHPTTGIFEGEPRQCPGFTFRKSLVIGFTELTSQEVRSAMEELAEEYKGNAYNLISKNCNHFCNDACIRLTGNPVPSWVNRLARIGFLCNCIIPASVSATKVSRDGKKQEVRVSSSEEEDTKLCRRSRSFTPSSNSSSSSPSESAGRGNQSHQPASPLIMDSPSSSSAANTVTDSHS